MRKLKVFFMNHWVTMVIIITVVVLILLAILGLNSLESFYRNLTLATMPIQLLLAGVNAFIFVFFYLLFFKDGFSKMKKVKINIADINIRFKDVIGLEGAKKEAAEVVKLLKDRAHVRKIGGKVIKGLLLIGPPGCGKTLLAKAIATESGIPFLSMAGSEFVEVFVGVGSSRVRKLFSKARQYAYAEGACIVFIDELDVIGRERTFAAMGGGQETNSTLNQILVELDGLDSAKHNVIVIGATNASVDVLDKALLRPGRFDRKLYITNPNLQEREDLFKYYLSKIKYNEANVDIGRLARRTVYKSPADIENIIKEATLITTRNKKEAVDMDDLSEAMDRIDLGLETHLKMTPEERKQTAFHEAGHAVALYFLHPTDDVFKVTLKSRGDALGMVTHNPRQELHTFNRDKLIADISVALSGFIAEKLYCGTTSTGVSSDFQKATTIAHSMVWQLGMGSSKVIGDFTSIPENQISEMLKEKLNNDTLSIINDSLTHVETFLKKEWTLVEALSNELLEKDELDYDNIETIFKAHGKQKVVPAELI